MMAFLHDFYAMSMANIQPFKLWHLCTVEIEIAIAIGVEFLSFSSISVPIPIWIPIATVIIRIAGVSAFQLFSVSVFSFSLLTP
jgi:hypothetical protein